MVSHIAKGVSIPDHIFCEDRNRDDTKVVFWCDCSWSQVLLGIWDCLWSWLVGVRVEREYSREVDVRVDDGLSLVVAGVHG